MRFFLDNYRPSYHSPSSTLAVRLMTWPAVIAGAVPVADGGPGHGEGRHPGEASAGAQPLQGVGRHRQPHVTL